MFQKIESTNFPPTQTLLVWDGKCGFCKFWITRWQQQTQGKIKFVTYQEAAENFKDIPLKEFKKSSKIIEPDGRVYNGPDSAYRSLYIAGNKKWHRWYKTYKLFTYISDHGYNHIAKNRSFYFKITKAFLGSNPKKFQPYWVFYLLIVISILIYFSVK